MPDRCVCARVQPAGMKMEHPKWNIGNYQELRNMARDDALESSIR